MNHTDPPKGDLASGVPFLFCLVAYGGNWKHASLETGEVFVEDQRISHQPRRSRP